MEGRSSGWHRVEIKLCCLQHNASPTTALLGALHPWEMGCTGEVLKQPVSASSIPYPISYTEKRMVHAGSEPLTLLSLPTSEATDLLQKLLRESL